MSRKALVANEDLLARLSDAFRGAGYDGASLTLLSKATGLKKASLYHRFPGGKEQMVQEVLEEAGRWFARHVLEPLGGSGAPRERIEAMARELDVFYGGGERACFFNLLSSPIENPAPFRAAIRRMLEAFIAALARVAVDSGCPPVQAIERAERVAASIQGSLVLARGLGVARPFTKMLARLPAELLGSDGHA